MSHHADLKLRTYLFSDQKESSLAILISLLLPLKWRLQEALFSLKALNPPWDAMHLLINAAQRNKDEIDSAATIFMQEYGSSEEAEVILDLTAFITELTKGIPCGSLQHLTPDTTLFTLRCRAIVRERVRRFLRKIRAVHALAKKGPSQ